MLLGSELDLIKSEKTPDTKIRRYYSENDKESRNSPVNRYDPDVHTHNHACPETRERLVRNGHLHVDIEPYPYSDA